ncbi:MAG: polysaccharide deacetylase family protein [Caulobacteraceae bacterium]|nr:polysaccharide deacetylase family protein [Caulobacteraceae bacterium]
MTDADYIYSPTETLFDKVRRKVSRFVERRPARFSFARPTLSISFDDAPVTALRAGAGILEAAGVRGTFYISAGLGGRDSPMGIYAGMEEVLRVARAGHEVGCHTFSHLDCGRSERDVIACDVELNAATLAEHGLKPETFAYPYGEISPLAKRTLGDRFRALRTVNAGMIHGEADLAALPGVGVEGPDGPAKARKWLDKAGRRNGWIILFTHDVRPEPSAWGCTPDDLEALVQEALAAGFDVAPVEVALSRGLRTSGQARRPVG